MSPDHHAFADTFRRHSRSVVHAAESVLRDRHAAEEVAQDVFLRLWARPRYDADRGELGPSLRLAARSRALDVLRRRGAGDRTLARLRDVAVLEAPRCEEPHVLVTRERARAA